MPGIPTTHEPDGTTSGGPADSRIDELGGGTEGAGDAGASAPAESGPATPPAESEPASAPTESAPAQSGLPEPAESAPSQSGPAESAPSGRSRNRRRRSRRPRRPRTEQIATVPPDLSATREFTGTLSEIIPVINLTALGYADEGPMAAAMAKALLGRRWADEFGRITVNTPRPGTGQTESYTALIPAGLISDDRRVKRGITVAVKLTGIDVSDRRRDWYCDEFRVVE